MLIAVGFCANLCCGWIGISLCSAVFDTNSLVGFEFSDIVSPVAHLHTSPQSSNSKQARTGTDKLTREAVRLVCMFHSCLR